MNYGNDVRIDSTGFIFILYHPLRANSPSLFNGDILGTMRRKTYTTEYEPLCYKYCSVIDSVSTLYKSTISIESNLYDTIKTKDKEKWENKREVTIWHHPVSIINRNVSESECWFYMKRLQKHWNFNIDTIEVAHGLKTDLDNFSPKWYSVGDASKLDFRLNLNLRDLIDCQEVLIKFNGPFTLASISMEPDNKGYNYISFTNPYKLHIIGKKGLNFYASFPQMEKIQQIRTTVLLLIFPIFISWLIFLINKIIKIIKNEYTK
ncbi:hypothetical protein [Prevotella sp.]|uniref:hypothetical protein n=1 Tax=Prevotella sp. TaxID=59823 RepID=UPI002ABE9345|nr:hypothetical protein [Prevotella sp.]